MTAQAMLASTGLHDEHEAWYAEASAMELEERDFDVAATAQLPTDLFHAEAADLDPEFECEYEDWKQWLFDRDDLTHLLVIEQSCLNGMLLPWDQRGARLMTAPLEPLALAGRFFARCPRHVAAYLANYVYWFVRCERARRRGSPNWTPRMPLPPERFEFDGSRESAKRNWAYRWAWQGEL